MVRGVSYSDWIFLAPNESINVALTLQCGQVFCWQNTGVSWTGVIGSTVFSIQQVTDSETMKPGVWFRYSESKNHGDESATATISEFLNLNVDMDTLYTTWCDQDSSGHFSRIVSDGRLRGMRVCNQDPLECLISFIVSANNNIKRITKILHSIRSQCGQPIHLTDGTTHYTFPTLMALGALTGEALRELGLGYRAGYIERTVKTLMEIGGESAFLKHRALDDSSNPGEAREFLLQFTGVGRKVADCVLLYSFGYSSVVPIDTHMLAIAQRHYNVKSAATKNPKLMHDAVQEVLVSVFGSKAGWAQSILFASDLSSLASEKNNSDESKVVKRTKCAE